MAVPPATGRSAQPQYAPLPRRPVTEMITDLIMSQVRSGALKPGDRLPAEPELARQLQVGRGSLREAIRTLHTLGVLEVVRGRGTFVAEPMRQPYSPGFLGLSAANGADLAAILELRIGLEVTAASLACVRATEDDLALLAERADDHERAVEDGDLDARYRTDEAFHDAILLAAHNEHLHRTYQMIVPQMAEFRRETLRLERSSRRFVPGHRDIIDGIAARSPDDSREAVTWHICALYRELRSGMVSSGADTGAMLETGRLLGLFAGTRS